MRDLGPANLTGTWAISACLVLGAAPASQEAPPPDPPVGTTTENPTGNPVQDDSGPVTVDPPMRVSFRLADGVRVAGQLASWDDDGCDGSFGRRRWSDLASADARKLILRVMNPRTATEWVRAGAVTLRLEGGEPHAERLFDRAVRTDPAVAPRIEAARAAAVEERLAREAATAEVEAQRLATSTPEAKQWKPDPWPPLTLGERQRALGEMRAEAERMLTDSGAPLVPVMSQYFIVYSDMERLETARWARQMDKTCERLMKLFGITDEEGVFWGKPAVFLPKDRDRFQLIEAQAFSHLSPSSVLGVTHKDGPKLFINVHRCDDRREFAAALLHETVHAFMHRYLTPRRLPAWANEGLADYITAQMLEGDSVIDGRVRPEGLRYIRNGGDVATIMTLTYEDGTWPGRDEVGRSVGLLITERMIESNRLAYAAWVDAVKLGKAWPEALVQKTGARPEELAWLVGRYYQVND